MTVCPATTGLGQLVLVRHGESVGNVADSEARRNGGGRVEVETRDPDTPLSPRGVEQARAVARHLEALPSRDRPEVVLSSPYSRAARTAEVATEGIEVPLVFDERLRERDLGAFDGLTGTGIREHHPEEARRRERLGKFYYRPPGGESWTDVALRVRQLLSDVAATHGGRRVWVFTHQAVIMSFRVALEGLDEQRLLEVDRSEPLANCSLTRYTRVDGGPLQLDSFAETSHLEALDAPTTHERTAGDEQGLRSGTTASSGAHRG